MAIADKKLFEKYSPIKMATLRDLPRLDYIVSRLDADCWILTNEKNQILTCKRNNIRRFKSMNALYNVLVDAKIERVSLEIMNG